MSVTAANEAILTCAEAPELNGFDCQQGLQFTMRDSLIVMVIVMEIVARTQRSQG